MTIRLLNGGVHHIGMEIGLKSVVIGGESWNAGIDWGVYDRQENCNRFKEKSYPWARWGLRRGTYIGLEARPQKEKGPPFRNFCRCWHNCVNILNSFMVNVRTPKFNSSIQKTSIKLNDHFRLALHVGAR